MPVVFRNVLGPGPQDVMNPSDVWSQIREKELIDDEWKFKRERAQAALTREQGLSLKLKHELFDDPHDHLFWKWRKADDGI